MNKEHFLIELKIYLKPLPVQQHAAILNKYDLIFEERMANGESEEEIAKSLGKPRAIAEGVLQEFDISVPEKRLDRNGWQEITPEKEDNEEFQYGYHYSPEEDTSHPYDESFRQYERPKHSPFVRFFQIIGILSLNFFMMIWVFFTIAMLFFSGWLVAVVFLFSPILGAYSIFINYTDFTAFQLFLSILLSGAGIIGMLILTPLTKFFARGLKRYLQWNIAVLRGDI